MWLGWQPAVAMAFVLAGVGLTLRRSDDRARAVGAVAREAALVAALYAVWRVVMRLRSTELVDGLANGRTVGRCTGPSARASPTRCRPSRRCTRRGRSSWPWV